MFRENNISYDRVNYFNEPLTEAKLRDLLRKAGLSPLDVLRKGEAAFKELGITPETPPDEIVRWIIENPSLLQPLPAQQADQLGCSFLQMKSN